jgi:hypothetical protein
MSAAQLEQHQDDSVRVVSTKVSASLEARLRAAAKAEGRTRAEVVRRALEAWATSHRLPARG